MKHLKTYNEVNERDTNKKSLKKIARQTERNLVKNYRKIAKETENDQIKKDIKQNIKQIKKCLPPGSKNCAKLKDKQNK